MGMTTQMDSLRSHLNYEPQYWDLAPAGGGVRWWTLRSWRSISTRWPSSSICSRSPPQQAASSGEEFYFAYDLRPSSSEFSSEAEGRGEIAQAIVAAIVDAGMQPVNLGRIPTPALAGFALAHNKAASW